MVKTKLLQTRLSKGLSQEELADLIGMTQSNYSRRENGHKNISDIEWDRIAKELAIEKEAIYEPDEKTSLTNNKKNIYQFNIPDFILEHIELLKKENKNLREKLKKLK